MSKQVTVTFDFDETLGTVSNLKCVMDGIEKSIPLPVITESLFARFRSRQEESYGAKILAALRNEFGGHSIKLK